MSRYPRRMSAVTHARSKALAGVCRLVKAAERHDQSMVSIEELRAVLVDVDVDGLASPRPQLLVRNVGEPFTPSEMSLRT